MSCVISFRRDLHQNEAVGYESILGLLTLPFAEVRTIFAFGSTSGMFSAKSFYMALIRPLSGLYGIYAVWPG